MICPVCKSDMVDVEYNRIELDYCTVCNQTFSADTGTIYRRLRTASATIMIVIVFLVYGCPPQGIVTAYGYDNGCQ